MVDLHHIKLLVDSLRLAEESLEVQPHVRDRDLDQPHGRRCTAHEHKGGTMKWQDDTCAMHDCSEPLFDPEIVFCREHANPHAEAEHRQRALVLINHEAAQYIGAIWEVVNDMIKEGYLKIGDRAMSETEDPDWSLRP